MAIAWQPGRYKGSVAPWQPPANLSRMNCASGTILLVTSLLCCPLLFRPAHAAADERQQAPGTRIEHVDAEGAAKLLSSTNKIVVLDVRTPAEYDEGHMARAINLDFNAAGFAEQLGKLDRQTTYLVHCGAGGRSTKALDQFQKLGFKSVVHLDGGLKAWLKAGKPIEKQRPQ